MQATCTKQNIQIVHRLLSCTLTRQNRLTTEAEVRGHTTEKLGLCQTKHVQDDLVDSLVVEQSLHSIVINDHCEKQL